MGNYTSHGTYTNNSQVGTRYSNNFEELQRNIEHLVKYGGSQQTARTETINFTSKSSSDIDAESIKNLLQEGGSLDGLTVLARRARYNNFNSSQLGGAQKNKNQLSSIDEDDFNFLKETLKRHNNQSGGCGCTGTQSNDSPTSQEPVNYDVIKGGGNLTSATSDSIISYNILKGGNDTKEGSVVSATSDNSLGYEMLFGGNKDKKDKNKDKDEDDEDVDLDSENTDEETDEDSEDSEDEEDEEDEEEDEDYDESADGDELSRTKGSSTSSSSASSSSSAKQKRAKQKRQQKKKSKKLHRNHDYLNSSQSAGSSDEIVIDTKYLYSDNNKFYGSDDNSEYYGALRNRSMMN